MKHFLAISDLWSGEVQNLLDLAIKRKEEYFKKANLPLFVSWTDKPHPVIRRRWTAVKNASK